MLLKSFAEERARFQALSQGARSLLISSIAYGAAAPLLGLFTNAFIWRQNSDLVGIAIYNATWMAGVSIAFVVNGWLLASCKLSWLYAIGLVLQSATCVILFRLEVAQIGDLALLGVFCGSAAGIYWANRNLLSLQVTKGPLRDYFCGLESAIGTLLSVLSPLFCGWFLDFGLKTEGWSVVERYRFLAFVALIIQCVGAWYIVSARFEDYSPKSILALRASALWNRARLFTAVKGVAEGSGMFIPTLVVLRLVGEEGTVGSTQSLAMVFTTAALYIIASKMRFENRLRVLQLGVSSMILGAICLSCFYSGLGALSYLFLQTLAVQLLWVAANPIILDAINVDQKDSTDYYRYIVDRELCLNLGRVLGVCVVLSLCLFTSADITLRLAPLILALVTGLLLIISKGL